MRFPQASGFQSSQAGGQPSDPSLFSAILRACLTLSSTYYGYMHFSFHVFVYDTAIAGKLFNERSDKDVTSWSVSHLQSEEPHFSLKLFWEMMSENGIQPGGITAASVLKAWGRLKGIHIRKLVHGVVIKSGEYDDLFIGNSLINMYSKCNAVGSDFQVCREMSRKNNVSWNSMLFGFVFNETYSKALSLFNLMVEKGVEVDEVTSEFSSYMQTFCARISVQVRSPSNNSTGVRTE